MLATNHKPNFKGQDEGLWRRVKMLPWSHYFAPNERDHKLTGKLRDEAAGILAWAVEGAYLWYNGGLQEPPSIIAATAEYRATSDRMAGFYPDGPLEKGTEADSVLGSVAYHLYEEWCEDEGLPLKERLSRQFFYTTMEERGAVKHRTAGGIALRNIKKAVVKTVEPDTLDTVGHGIFRGVKV